MNTTGIFTLCAVVAVCLLPNAAAAQQDEPFGPGVGGWSVLQRAHKTKQIWCRTIAPGGKHIIGRFGDGSMYVSVPANKMPKGKDYEGLIRVRPTDSAEMVEANSDGARLGFIIGDYILDQIIQARRFEYGARINGQDRSGVVTFDASVGAAVDQIKACTRMNGGV